MPAIPASFRHKLLSFLLTSLLVCFADHCVRAGETDEPVGSAESPITSEERDHWSFQALTRPQVPTVHDHVWCSTPIDRFILRRIEEAGLGPMPAADPHSLIRRVTFDLTGLPPTPEEIEAFVDHSDPAAYVRLVDRLLASWAYGERWAQHWLDLVRFAETDGFEHDHIRPDAWRYRDWVIDAVNRDLGYDEFVRLQLAGDELRPNDAWAANATGFLLCGPDMPDINLTEERRHNFLNDMTSTVGSVFLGLQVGCAQCHAHKYDPISQFDFYRLRAFFDHEVEFQARKTVRLNPQSTTGISHLMVRGDFRRLGPRVAPAYLRIVNPSNETVSRVPASGNKIGLRSALAHWLTRPDHLLATRVIVNRIWQYHMGHGISRSPSNFGVVGESPSHLGLLDWLAVELPSLGWSLKRFHRLIVLSSVYRQASRPTNQNWADQLAARARDNWKKSNRQDPDNELLARRSSRRLEGEAIRDAMLVAANQLSRRRGGPGIRPPLPKELLVTLLKNQWPVTENREDHYRRSIYLFVRRNLRFPLFEAFDKPDTNASCPRRNQSTIAPQALILLNSKLSLSAARALAGYLIEQSGQNRLRQIESCYMRTLGRRPTADEQQLAVEFLRDDAHRLRQDGRSESELAVPQGTREHVDPYAAAALTDFCLAMFNLNEFLYID